MHPGSCQVHLPASRLHHRQHSVERHLCIACRDSMEDLQWPHKAGTLHPARYRWYEVLAGANLCHLRSSMRLGEPARAAEPDLWGIIMHLLQRILTVILGSDLHQLPPWGPVFPSISHRLDANPDEARREEASRHCVRAVWSPEVRKCQPQTLEIHKFRITAVQSGAPGDIVHGKVAIHSPPSRD